MPMNEYPPILLDRHVAELVGLKSPESARDWIRAEGVPHVQAGRRMLVRLEALLRWMEANETSGLSRPAHNRRKDGRSSSPLQRALDAERLRRGGR